MIGEPIPILHIYPYPALILIALKWACNSKHAKEPWQNQEPRLIKVLKSKLKSPLFKKIKSLGQILSWPFVRQLEKKRPAQGTNTLEYLVFIINKILIKLASWKLCLLIYVISKSFQIRTKESNANPTSQTNKGPKIAFGHSIPWLLRV